jgi:heme/copper-type cytochrome/quinol oxidase subunit 1
LIFGLIAIITSVGGMIKKRAYSSTDNKISLFFMIFFFFLLLMGIILFYLNGWFAKMKSMGEVMKNSYDRFFIVEHGFIMILAWILVHVGRTAVKKAAPESKHKKTLIFFGIAILLILISIPWSFKGGGIARPDFPKF